MVCLYLLRRKQIINPDRFLGLSGLVVLFDKLEFISLGEVFDHDMFNDSVFVVIDCNVFAFFAC